MADDKWEKITYKAFKDRGEIPTFDDLYNSTVTWQDLAGLAELLDIYPKVLEVLRREDEDPMKDLSKEIINYMNTTKEGKENQRAPEPEAPAPEPEAVTPAAPAAARVERRGLGGRLFPRRLFPGKSRMRSGSGDKGNTLDEDDVMEGGGKKRRKSKSKKRKKTRKSKKTQKISNKRISKRLKRNKRVRKSKSKRGNKCSCDSSCKKCKELCCKKCNIKCKCPPLKKKKSNRKRTNRRK